ncbi:MAG: septum formation initiator family protein [bacterium]
MFKIESIKFKSIFLLAVILAGFFSISFIKETYRNYKINKEIKNLKENIEFLRNENLELLDFIKYLKTDNFIENEARLKFGMKKLGEKTFIIEKNLTEKNGVKINKEIAKEISNIQKWRNYFFEE